MCTKSDLSDVGYFCSFVHRLILIALLSLTVACGGGGGSIYENDSASENATEDNSTGDGSDSNSPGDTNSDSDTDNSAGEEPQEPEVITVPFDNAVSGSIDGVNIWQMPDAPDGSRPDQSWLAVGSDDAGEIYISGHDHQVNSMLYRLYQSDNTLRWVGDAKTASEAANNWQAGESAEKFHTRPIFHDGTVYVATLDSSSMDSRFLNTRGFHWYGYHLDNNSFTDLSASEPNGVGAETLQIVTIQKDPVNNLLYGMSIPENKLVRYDIAAGITTVLGKPSAWSGYFYSNRYMWVDSRGRVYITGGSSRGQWNQGESASTFNHVWYYDPQTGFGELPNFALQGPNAIEVGQWDRRRENLYVSDDQGHIYRFNDAAASWTFVGRPSFSNSLKTWVFQLSADEEKIYIGLSDGPQPNAIHEFDIATGTSVEILKIDDIGSGLASENFIAGYDSWDSRGSFHISYFSMYDGDNAYMLGINPVRAKVVKGLLPELVELSASLAGGQVELTRSGMSSNQLEVLYQVRGFDSSGNWIATAHGELSLGANQLSVRFNLDSLNTPAENAVVSTQFVLVGDGNDYIVDDASRAGLNF
jgi:hypothetical protein